MGLTPQEVDALLAAFEESSWLELTLEVGGDTLHVSRRPDGRDSGASDAPSPNRTRAASADGRVPSGDAPAPPPPATVDAEPIPENRCGIPVVSPSIGLFWRAPAPGAPPFVEVGSRVGADDTVGIVEVMKLMSPIRAGVAGIVTAVLVDNGAMVEHGQPLVLVETA